MEIISKYKSGSFIRHGGEEIIIEDYRADVPIHIGKQMLLMENYTIALKNYTSIKNAKRILFIREMGMGDVLLMTAIIRYIKQKVNEQVKIDVLIPYKYKCLYENNQFIDNVYDVDSIPNNMSEQYNHICKLNEIKYDIYKQNSNVHKIDLFLKNINGEIDNIPDKHLDYYVSGDEIKWAREQNIKNPYIVMILVANNIKKSLPRDYLINISVLLGIEGYKVVLISNRMEGWNRHNVIDLTNKLTVRQCGALISLAAGVLTPDTGFMHMASALDKKVICYFGGMDWKLLRTHDKLLPLYSKSAECYPCNKLGCDNTKCIRDLMSEYVVDKTIEYMEEN